jgi:proteasome accessory factor PafA2
VAVPKVCGIETEYGVVLRGTGEANPVLASSMLINGYVEHHKVGWDFEDESPGRDARGFARDGAQPPEIETHLVNTVLTNGARYYVDHAHPEYSTPECADALELVIADKAGERVLARSMLAARRLLEPGQEVVVYKNNSDGKGNSYGTHENYLVDRAVPFANLVRYLLPWFVTRQVFTGAGKVGGENGAGLVDYQLSQRADFFEAEVGLETTIRRPIINTRDEPHSTADKYRRLHVIIGDANLSQVSNYLKFGTTALVLSLIEAGLAPKIEVYEPVPALKAVSHDTSLTAKVRLLDGRRVTALDLQWMYHEAAAKLAQDTGVGDAVDGDGHTHEVLERWATVLTQLDNDRAAAAGSVEWLAKLSLLDGYRQRDGLEWSDARLGLVDLQWSDIRPEKGLYYRLLARGRMQRVVEDAAIAAAVAEPPQDTRAFFRGKCISSFGKDVVGASWDSVIFDVPGYGRLQRVPTREPLRGTKDLTGALFERYREAGPFLGELLGHNSAPPAA